MRYILLIFTMILLSCNFENESVTKNEVNEPGSIEKIEQITVELTDIKENILMSDYFSTLKYVHLKTPDNHFIGRTEKILVNDDFVALFDKSQYSVWVFSHEGEFINKVQIPEGRGPGEIIHISDVIITDDHLVRALGALKIVVYNLEGEFVEETEMNFRAYNIAYDDSSDLYIAYAGNSLNSGLPGNYAGNNLIFFDHNGRIEKSFLPIEKGREHIGFEVPNNFPRHNDNQQFFTHLVDTIYAIGEGAVFPQYVLDYGRNAIPDDVWNRRERYDMPVYQWADFWNNEIINNDYIAYLFFFNETDSFIHFRIGTRDKQYNILYDKTTKEVFTGPGRFTNDIDYGYVPFIYESHDNALYSIIEANDLLRHLHEVYENEPEKYTDPKMRKLIELAHSLSANSNPILKIATFKTFDEENDIVQF